MAAKSKGGKKAAPISVFAFGLGGVNLVKDPLMLDDNELVLAQNAEPYKNEGISGVRKRPGLQAVVPTGSVTPSPAAAGIVASYTINTDDANNPNPNSVMAEFLFGGGVGLLSTNGGSSFSAVSGQAGLGSDSILPNVKYTFPAGSPYEFLPCFSGVRCGSAFVFGGHTAGSVVANKTVAPPAAGSTSGPTITTRGITIFPGDTNADDTFVLSGVWQKPFGAGALYATVITTGGQCALYAPATDDIIALPNFTSNALATGSIFLNGRLWVANGTNISSIRPGVDSAWTDNAVTLTGVTQLLGLSAVNGVLYAGTKQTSSSAAVYIVKATPNSDGTAAVAVSLQVSVSTAPTYFFGPCEQSGGGLPIYSFLVNGSNGTLAGADAGAADSTTQRCIVSFTTAAKWRVSLDVQGNVSGFNGSNNRNVGAFTTRTTSQGYYWVGEVVDSGTEYMVLGLAQGSAAFNLFRQPITAPTTYPLYIS